ncbi:Hypothetical_protein [Hexamita inflata]|uniref:Hypothetical_protein n=1 Tax=Hexamita inflata TaxID=28002 RepID=A0AA86UVZ5_9EUKA|nr:Hypothetical protein HINF_LOCUS61635 [Hexamita inflata]
MWTAEDNCSCFCEINQRCLKNKGSKLLKHSCTCFFCFLWKTHFWRVGIVDNAQEGAEKKASAIALILAIFSENDWNGSRESEQEFMQAMTGMALLSEAQAQLMQIYENQLLYNCKQTTTISNKTIQPPCWEFQSCQ